MNEYPVLTHDGSHPDHPHHDGQDGHEAAATGPEEGLVVRRHAALSAAVGGVASAVAIAYLARATGSGAWLDWALCLVMGAVALVHLLALVDSRGPLLVADTQGVRIRQGRAWTGMTWDSLASVEHLPRRGLLRDGRIDVVTEGPDEQVLSVPLSMSTRVTAADPDLTVVLADLAGPTTEVVELDPTLPVEDEAEPDEVAEPHDEVAEVAEVAVAEPAEAEPAHEPTDDSVDEPTDEPGDHPAAPYRRHDPRPALARGIGALAARLSRRPGATPAAETVEDSEQTPLAPVVASSTPSPLREPVTAVRAEISRDLATDAVLGANALDLGDGALGVRRDLPEGRELRRPGSVDLVEDTVLWGQRPGAQVAPTPAIIDGFGLEQGVRPAADPVIGPELAAARTRLGLSVDQLAERTRIRPHVIESIEVDDFAPCGGDFYARGHLRTLARVLGADATPLLASYDERYADAPIDPRRVFEAELATGAGGSIRGTRGGPSWSVLVAAVMALVLAWSVARLVMDSPVDLDGEALILNGSRGIDNGSSLIGEPVEVLLTAAGGGTNVVVRDGSKQVVFSGDLAFGESKSLRIAPPVRVQSSDGSLEVGIAGAGPEPVGEAGQPAQGTFVAPAE